LSSSTDSSSGAVQSIDLLVTENESRRIDLRPKSDRSARGGSWLLMRMLDWKRLQCGSFILYVGEVAYSSEIPMGHGSTVQEF